MKKWRALVWRWVGRVCLVVGVVAGAITLTGQVRTLFFPSNQSSGPAGHTSAPQMSQAPTPCAEVVRRGYRCAPEDLIAALPSRDRDTIRFFVRGGIDGYTRIGERTVFGIVQPSSLPDFTFLVDVMVEERAFERKSREICETQTEWSMVSDASDEFFPLPARCAIARQDACLGESVARTEAASREEHERLQAAYERSQTVRHCAQDLASFGRESTYRANFNIAYEAGDCGRTFSPEPCHVALCRDQIIPEFRRKFPDLDEYVRATWILSNESRDARYFRASRLRSLLQRCQIATP